MDSIQRILSCLSYKKKWSFKALNTKPIIPSDKEIQLNSRARSAKLRIAEKIEDES